jgi:beta-xylosidase
MKVTNPIIWADFPDPDVIRVDDVYYMVSTTMFVMPGGPILKSRDLCHWETVSYIFGTIEDNDIYQLRNGKHAYGRVSGQRASNTITECSMPASYAMI